jgi:hypothetical protein
MKSKKFGSGGPTAKPKASDPRMREPITGGPDTVPLTPERKKFLEEMRRRNAEAAKDASKAAKKATPYAKGGKTMKKATKAGKAMMNKSADAKGRAMPKYAKGGSASARADGIAKKGKTKGKMLAGGGKCM